MRGAPPALHSFSAGSPQTPRAGFVSSPPASADVPVGADDRAARRGRSLRALRREGVPGGESAPFVVAAPRRRVREVVRRLVALALVSGRGRGMTLEAVRTALAAHRAARWLTRSEVSFLRRSRLTRAETARAAWSAEACHALLWAIGGVKTLGRPKPARQPGLSLGLLSKLGPGGLAARAKLRPQGELLDALDLVACAHAAMGGLRRHRTDTREDWVADVVAERLHALTWLVTDGDWDEIGRDVHRRETRL